MKVKVFLKDNWQTVLRVAFFVAIIATLTFIFYNSTLPPEASEEQSGAVGDFIATIIPPDTSIGNFIITYIRKIAHFSEYGLLGIEIAAYIVVFYKEKRVKRALTAFLVPVVVSFVDESIQILSDRGPSISDMWIDVGGFITFSLLAYGVCYLAYLVAKLICSYLKQRSHREEKSDG
jgi:VanZ family protein